LEPVPGIRFRSSLFSLAMRRTRGEERGGEERRGDELTGRPVWMSGGGAEIGATFSFAVAAVADLPVSLAAGVAAPIAPPMTATTVLISAVAPSGI